MLVVMSPTNADGNGNTTPAGPPERSVGATERFDAADLGHLLKLSARGQQQAFALLYDQTSARMFGLVLRIVRNRAQAEEVLQEAYVDIWRSSARFNPSRGSALGWLFSIGHRRAVDRVRSEQAATSREAGYHARGQVTAYDDASEQALRSLEAERVRRALNSLTRVQKAAIELVFFGGYTHREVAGLLELPLGTAKTRIRDGLIRLRDTLGVQS